MKWRKTNFVEKIRSFEKGTCQSIPELEDTTSKDKFPKPSIKDL